MNLAQLRTWAGRLLGSSLRRRLGLGVGLVVAVLMSLFVLDLTRRQADSARTLLAEEATALSNSVAASAAVWVASRDYAGLQEIVEGLRRYPHLQHAMVLDPAGLVLAHTERERVGRYLHDLPEQAATTTLHHSDRQVDIVSPVRLSGRLIGWARIGLDDQALQQRHAEILRQGAAYALAAVLLSLAVAWVAAALLTRRLARIEAAASSNRGDGIWMRAELRGDDEAARLAQQFNLMLDALEERKTALAELNATLESRVARRTAELEGKNHELAAALQALERAHQQTRDALDQLRRTQAELVRAEKMAGLGTLVAGVAHELNTPIGNALMMASSLADGCRSFEQQATGQLRRADFEQFLRTVRESSQVLLRNIERAATLVSSFKQVAIDPGSYQRRRFDLRAMSEEALQTLKPALRGAHVSLRLEIPAGIELEGYPGPLGQVLQSLVHNALTHAFAPGQPGRVTLRAEDGGTGEVQLVVEDDGCGIAPEVLPRIFDPFFTTRMGRGGAGLGLSIAYNIVTGLLGGRIAVDSVPDHGTRFTLHLPARAPASDAP
ncbi:ATP-binding protein [Pelomonas sp. CA6]|uniref:ATP-binding protein n=1 Tax=Pelomonas sp. CA6 TaxID=2907999 RepID=UPI001F4B0CFF|nr:ATP-binding protein [Pelomonas sp. CA6]MCH7342051.1 ATP-binding protein [Pelomonas sp. CA6]